MKALFIEFLKCTVLSIQMHNCLIVATDGETLLTFTNENEMLDTKQWKNCTLDCRSRHSQYGSRDVISLGIMGRGGGKSGAGSAGSSAGRLDGGTEARSAKGQGILR